MDTTLWLVAAGAVAALAVGAYLFVRSRRVGEEPLYHFRCPGCGRRLRFRARQAGNKGSCSNCGHKLTFPPAADCVD